MNEITTQDIDTAVQDAQEMLDTTGAAMASGRFQSQEEVLKAALASGRLALAADPQAAGWINDALAVMSVLYAQDMLRRDEPYSLSDDKLATGCVHGAAAAATTTANMAEHMARFPDITDAEIAREEISIRFAESTIFHPQDPVRHFGLSQALVAITAMIRLAKLANALPGLLEAYGASMEASGVKRNMGLMQDCGDHRATALELRDEIMSLVSGGN